MLSDPWSYTTRTSVNTTHSSHTADAKASWTSHIWRWFYILLCMNGVMPLVDTDWRASRHMVATVGWSCWMVW